MNYAHSQSRMQLVEAIQFVVLLAATLVLSVSVVALLPPFLSPELVPLAMTAAAIDERMNRANSWAIWGGLGLDLVSPGQFGLIWFPLLLAAAALHGLKRLATAAELPWLWPVWFFVVTALSLSLLAISTHQWLPWLTEALVTALWGTIFVGFTRWITTSRSPE